MRKQMLILLIGAIGSLPAAAMAADAQRQAQVAARGAEVMPFSLRATSHIFTRSADGGVQRVVARDAQDAAQVRRVRAHLQAIQTQFSRGDFSAPRQIHGSTMPGLAQLQAAAGQITIQYQPVEGGAELIYRSANTPLVAALHDWFDAQVADHGSDAMAGHQAGVEHQGVNHAGANPHDTPPTRLHPHDLHPPGSDPQEADR